MAGKNLGFRNSARRGRWSQVTLSRCATWPWLVQCTRFNQPLSMWFLLLRWLMSHYSVFWSKFFSYSWTPISYLESSFLTAQVWRTGQGQRRRWVIRRSIRKFNILPGQAPGYLNFWRLACSNSLPSGQKSRSNVPPISTELSPQRQISSSIKHFTRLSERDTP